jgi:hypothetical protein
MRYWEHSYYLGNLERVLNDLRLKLHKVSVKQTFISVTDRGCFYLVIKLEQEEKNTIGKGD